MPERASPIGSPSVHNRVADSLPHRDEAQASTANASNNRR